MRSGARDFQGRGFKIRPFSACVDACVPTHNKEKGSCCSDGLDNDCDALNDGADPDC